MLLFLETDKKIEDVIRNKIRSRYPYHVFIGEETVSGGGMHVVLLILYYNSRVTSSVMLLVTVYLTRPITRYLLLLVTFCFT